MVLLALVLLGLAYVVSPNVAAAQQDSEGPPRPAPSPELPGVTTAGSIVPSVRCEDLNPQRASKLKSDTGRSVATCVRTNGGFHTLAIQPTSPTCRSDLDAKYYTKRLDSCQVASLSFVLYDLNTLQEIGRVNFTLIHYMYLSARETTWASQLQLVEDARTPGVSVVTVEGTASCAGACTMGSSSFPPQTMSKGTFDNGESYINGTSINAGNTGEQSTSRWQVVFTHPGALPSGLDVQAQQVPVRCDNSLPNSGPGCIFPGGYGAINYALSGPYPELARHIRDAQASGLPGGSISAPLNRIYRGDDSKDNRTAACPKEYTRPTGKTCDEYPFATSSQGAASTSTTTGRTFSYCSIPQLRVGKTGPGYSACMIDGTQNSTGGSRLGAMYLAFRILQGDPFLVQIVP